METRSITIINSRTQSQRVIEASTATTLGELKREMRALNIPYDGMSFFEGHIRAELKDDASILPTNIPYKGQVVNDLIFLLSNPEKKIKSGAYTRKELYDQIKEADLQEECIKRYGKNFTLCKSTDLISLLREPVRKEPAQKTLDEYSEAPVPKKVEENKGSALDGIIMAFAVLVNSLYADNIISECTYLDIFSELENEDHVRLKGSSGNIIEEMFDFV